MVEMRNGTSPARMVAAVIDIVSLTLRNNLILFDVAMHQVRYCQKI